MATTYVLFYVLFVVSIGYSVIGNIVVFIALRRQKVPLRFGWSGMPGYLYGRCVRAGVGIGLQRFALSTNVAFGVAFLCLPVVVTR